MAIARELKLPLAQILKMVSIIVHSFLFPFYLKIKVYPVITIVIIIVTIIKAYALYV